MYNRLLYSLQYYSGYCDYVSWTKFCCETDKHSDVAVFTTLHNCRFHSHLAQRRLIEISWASAERGIR